MMECVGSMLWLLSLEEAVVIRARSESKQEPCDGSDLIRANGIDRHWSVPSEPGTFISSSLLRNQFTVVWCSMLVVCKIIVIAASGCGPS